MMKQTKNRIHLCHCCRYAQHVTSLEFTGIEELVNRLVEVSKVEGDGNDDLPITMMNISPTRLSQGEMG